MKNIETILAEFGIAIPEDKKTEFNKAFGENYKTVNDWQNQKDKVSNLETQLNTAREDLKKFEGVDAADLQRQIVDLNKKLSDAETEYNAKIADRDFHDLLNAGIAERNGLNPKAITALLDIDTLKGSKNQKDDIGKALDALAEAEDSSMLFGGTETAVGKMNPIGKVGGGSASGDLSKMRAVMGLPPEKN